MSQATLLTEDVNGVRWVTINRPDKLNALNRDVILELETTFSAIAADAAVRAAVVTGAGEKAFVAGADIAEFVGMDAAAAGAIARRGQAVFAAIEASSKPVVAAVNGFALGGGCELAMACHLRVAAPHARFGQPEVKLGLIPGYGGTQRLPRLVGRGRAMELLLTGGMIDAATALSWGLVNRVVAAGEVRAAAQKLAEEIAAHSPVAVGHCVAAVLGGEDRPLRDALALEAQHFGESGSSADAREGISAFLEKRPPRFAGS